jgi:antitoxin StbD
MPHTIFAHTTVSISELKKNPIAAVASGNGTPVAVINQNELAFYCIPAAAYEELLDRLGDVEYNRFVDERRSQPEVAVSLDNL